MAQHTASGDLLAKSRLTKRGKVVLEGKRGTFVIDARQTANPNAWGVYQRVGSGRRNIRALWFYRTRITLRPRLGFYSTVDRIVSTRLDELMSKTIAHVIDTSLARMR
jgi:sirohydrochlorin ferrochelatase